VREFEWDLNPIFIWPFATTQSATTYNCFTVKKRGSETHQDFFDVLLGNEVKKRSHTCWNSRAEP